MHARPWSIVRLCMHGDRQTRQGCVLWRDCAGKQGTTQDRVVGVGFPSLDHSNNISSIKIHTLDRPLLSKFKSKNNIDHLPSLEYRERERERERSSMLAVRSRSSAGMGNQQRVRRCWWISSDLQTERNPTGFRQTLQLGIGCLRQTTISICIACMTCQGKQPSARTVVGKKMMHLQQ
jgi:hypothetical protein